MGTKKQGSRKKVTTHLKMEVLLLIISFEGEKIILHGKKLKHQPNLFSYHFLPNYKRYDFNK